MDKLVTRTAPPYSSVPQTHVLVTSYPKSLPATPVPLEVYLERLGGGGDIVTIGRLYANCRVKEAVKILPSHVDPGTLRQS